MVVLVRFSKGWLLRVKSEHTYAAQQFTAKGFPFHFGETHLAVDATAKVILGS